MTLQRFAYRISGPIDAAINLTINAAIPAYLLPWDGNLPIFGLPSTFGFIGTMVFCVGLFATFFGFRNGVLQRAGGVEPGPLSPGSRWSGIAWRTGFFYAVAGYLVAGALFFVLRVALPEPQVPCWLVIVSDGLLAAVLGYSYQVRGVLLAERL